MALYLVLAALFGLSGFSLTAQGAGARIGMVADSAQRFDRFVVCALTRPGGVVLYATCSPHLAETVGVVADALRRHPVTAMDTKEFFPGVDQLGDGPYVQLWPHLHGTDAMFAAALKVG